MEGQGLAISTIDTGMQLTVDEMKSHVAIIDEMTKAVMKDGMHYGKIPGCGNKPTLLKPGAEKLALAFQLTSEYEVTRDEMRDDNREYHIECKLYSRGGVLIGTGLGNCSTMEGKYRFRTQLTGEEVPAEFWKTRDIELLGGSQYSYKKVDNVWMINEKIVHDNPADYYNTCEKMAKKRAFVDAILTCTAASDHFTQDVEDNPELYGGTGGVDTSNNATSSAGKDDTIKFGKHKGSKWTDIDSGYLSWLADNGKPDAVASANAELERRANGEEATTSAAPNVVMAQEKQIREIKLRLEEMDLKVIDFLSEAKLDSLDQIRMCDVKTLNAWLDDTTQELNLPAF